MSAARRAAAILTFAPAAFLSLLLYPPWSADPPRPDEARSLRSFEIVAEGRNPYTSKEARGRDRIHPYLPSFHAAGGRLVRAIGAPGTNILSRWAFSAGVAAVAILSAGLAATRSVVRAPLALALTTLPFFARAWDYGNLNPAGAALTLVPLFLWPRAPLFAGLALAGGIVLKPLGLAAPALLYLHRSRRAGVRHRIAAGIAGLTVALSVLSTGWLNDFRAQPRGYADAWDSEGSVALQRVLQCAGLDLGAEVLFALSLVLGAAVLFARPRSPRFAAFWIAFFCVLGLPRVWFHTLALAVPALAVSASRRAATLWASRSETREARTAAVLAGLGFVVAALVLFRAEAWAGYWRDLPGFVAAPMAALPLAAFAGLTADAARARIDDPEPGGEAGT